MRPRARQVGDAARRSTPCSLFAVGAVLAMAGVASWAVGCGTLDEGERGALCVAVGTSGQDIETITFAALAALLADTGATDRVEVSLTNCGNGPLTVTAVGLAATNAHGRAANPDITLDFGSTDPKTLLPAPLEPNDPLSTLTVWLTYSPTSCGEKDCYPGDGATLEITADDGSTRAIEATPPPCASKGRVDPPKDTYLSASPVAPETKIFQISNQAQCQLSVTSVEFASATSVFTLNRSWTDGATIPANGDPLTFEVTYKPAREHPTDQIDVVVTFADGTTPPTITIPLDAAP